MECIFTCRRCGYQIKWDNSREREPICPRCPKARQFSRGFGAKHVLLTVLTVVIGISSISGQASESITISNLRVGIVVVERDGRLLLPLTVDFENREPHQTNLWLIQIPPGGSKGMAWVCDLPDATLESKSGSMSCTYTASKFKMPKDRMLKFQLKVKGGYSNALGGSVSVP